MNSLPDFISSKNRSPSVAESILLTVHVMAIVLRDGNMMAKTEVTKKMQRNTRERTTMELRGRSSLNTIFVENSLNPVWNLL
jgi:hypothetical protein